MEVTSKDFTMTMMEQGRRGKMDESRIRFGADLVLRRRNVFSKSFSFVPRSVQSPFSFSRLNSRRFNVHLFRTVVIVLQLNIKTA